MKRFFKKSGVLVRKLKKGILAKKRYLTYREKREIDKRLVLLESQHGRSLDGNVFAVLEELNQNADYRDFRTVVSATKENKAGFSRMLKQKGMTGVRLVTYGSPAYFKVLATAGWLVNDNTFIFCFIKRKGQVYLNTWHGTPLKTLGKRSKSEYATIGNAQKTFLDSDYVVYPNEFTKNVMLRDYCMENLGTFQPLLCGYPRNIAFFKTESAKELRRKYNLDQKTVYAYLPTWRGTIGNVADEEQEQRLYGYLRELDKRLDERCILYVKMHTVSKTVLSFEGFSHIFPFPKEETYEFLNATDGLITDYSSIMFDYAVSGKKIILFPYDYEQYEAERGLYFPLKELPFPQVTDAKELSEQMHLPKNYDDSEFLKKFCPYDGPDAAKLLCRHVFGKTPSVKESPIPDNHKENVLLYCGDLALNGVTVSIQNLLASLDTSAKNYTLLVKTSEIKKNAFRLLELPEGVNYLGFSECKSQNLCDTLRFKLWTGKHPIGKYEKLRPMLARLGAADAARIIGGARVNTVVHFNGYSNHMTLIFEAFSCRRVIYAHNDMDAELRTRIRMKREILSNAYRTYDAVAVVTPDLLEPIAKVATTTSFGHEPSIRVVRNVIDYRGIQKKGALPLTMDEQTKVFPEQVDLNDICRDSRVKIITIGRFSPEKGHKRLMEQYASLLSEYPDSILIILGSRGVLYQETVEYAKSLGLSDRLVIVYYLSNPYPLLKSCDYFIFPSYYEGFGLVLAEADILGVPCVSTDIVGPKQFMERYGGKLVQNSEEGVRQALAMCMSREKLPLLAVDYEKYNREAVQEFLQVISE